MSKTIEIAVAEDIRDMVQKAHIERDARRDILVYILANPDLNISKERIDEYQKEYDEKFSIFEQVKQKIEDKYVMPATNGKASNWSLDYSTCIITITINDNE